MGRNHVPLRAYLRYLQSLGLVGKGRRGGSHERWNYPDGMPQLARSLTVDHHYDEVPLLHFKTNATSLGRDWQDLWDEMIEGGFMKGARIRSKRERGR